MNILAQVALLPNGWAKNVFVSFDADGGLIDQVIPEPGPELLSSVAVNVPILLPAPVNVHSHAFQRAMAGLTEHQGPNADDNFWTWRNLMFRFLEQLTPEHVESITALVQMEMLESGYATNVEFHYLHHQTDGTPFDNPAEMCDRVIAATQQTGIGLTLLPVHYQFGGCDQRGLGAGQIRFGTGMPQFQDLHSRAAKSLKQLSRDCRMGLAPHSLRAVGVEQLKELVSWAGDDPIHLHLAEQIAEVEEVVKSRGLRPVEWLLENVEVDGQFCLIHCTQMLAHETESLARTGAVAGLCPITESNLGDGIFDCVRWLSENGKLAVGSDSNVRISLSEELRTLDYSQRLRDHSRAPFATPEKSSGRAMFDAMVAGGAQAAGRDSGRIEAGRLADLLALADDNVYLSGAEGDQILDRFIFAGDDSLVAEVWSAGRHVVTGGKHVQHDQIVSRYLDVAKQLMSAI